MFQRKRRISIPEAVKQICHKLNEHGYQAYIVGGAVRDALLELNPTDWDITTDALPDRVRQIFPKNIPSGQRFGTITVVSDNLLVDVTTMRREALYSNQRHPDYVKFCNDIEQDLSRRDFTINAVAYNPLTNQFIDPFGGITDLCRKRIRTVGNAKLRFSEDALRMLRLIRFSAVLNFKPETQTIAAIQPKLLIKIASERIKDELSKLLVADKIVKPLQLMYTSGIMEQILPELAHTANISQGAYHRWDVLGHLIMTAQSVKPDLNLRLAALFHDIGKSETRIQDESGIHFYGHDKIGAAMTHSILTRLTFSKRIQDKVSLLIKHHMFQIHPNSTDKAIRKLIAKVGTDNIHDLLELRKADIMAMKYHPRQTLNYYRLMRKRIDEILAENHAFTRKDLAVSGSDLINELNLTPGPQIGQILKYLLDIVIEQPKINNYTELIERARKYIN